MEDFKPNREILDKIVVYITVLMLNNKNIDYKIEGESIKCDENEVKKEIIKYIDEFPKEIEKLKNEFNLSKNDILPELELNKRQEFLLNFFFKMDTKDAGEVEYFKELIKDFNIMQQMGFQTFKGFFEIPYKQYKMILKSKKYLDLIFSWITRYLLILRKND